MTDQQLRNKVRQDVAGVNKDLSTLVGDNAVQVSRFGDNVSQAVGQAKDDLTTWIEGGASQLSEGFEKITGEATEAMVEAAATVKKDVGHGLSQYNAKAQEVADKVPGDFGAKTARYPWVAITIALMVGLVLGGFLRPSWRLHG